MSGEPYITGSEVAERLGVSLAWVVRSAKSGDIPGVRLGTNGPRRFLWVEIEAWLDATRRDRETTERAMASPMV
jgi:excisionase family DNA binding protein